MTKRERLEDLGKLSIMINNILDNEFFNHTDSKHGFEQWKAEHHDKEEYGCVKGIENIFCEVRWLKDKLDECLHIAYGEEDEH